MKRVGEYILSLSYGKDSLACLGAIDQLGWPLDRIVHAEVWATDTIPADLPPMVEFKAKADGIIKERWGIEVEHIRVRQCYEDLFYSVCHGEKSKIAGNIYGWPFQRGPWCNSRLKQRVLEKFRKGVIQYIGIAADESGRFHNLTDTKKSPLVEAGWTEADCRRWCEENDLLSPIYTTATRGGCWFCHNQGVDQLKCLFYMPTARKVDLTNLLEAADDALVTAGVLADDNSKIVVSHDGSRVLLDRDKPRTEIYITEVRDGM